MFISEIVFLWMKQTKKKIVFPAPRNSSPSRVLQQQPVVVVVVPFSRPTAFHIPFYREGAREVAYGLLFGRLHFRPIALHFYGPLPANRHDDNTECTPLPGFGVAGVFLYRHFGNTFFTLFFFILTPPTHYYAK